MLFCGWPSCCLLASTKSPCLMVSMGQINTLRENSQEDAVPQQDHQDSGTHLLRTHSTPSPLRVLTIGQMWMDFYIGIFFPIHTPIYGNPNSSPCLISQPSGKVQQQERCEKSQHLSFPSHNSTAVG